MPSLVEILRGLEVAERSFSAEVLITGIFDVQERAHHQSRIIVITSLQSVASRHHAAIVHDDSIALSFRHRAQERCCLDEIEEIMVDGTCHVYHNRALLS